jgi:hypothetical protein
MTQVSVMTRIEYAPRTSASAASSDSTGSTRGLRAIRCRKTSVSLVVWKIAPSRSRRLRISTAFTRLPLCTMPAGPMLVLTTIGWALLITLLPAVE